MIWPFRKLTPEQREEREWRRYRNHFGSTLAARGYRGDPVTVEEAFEWADSYVAHCRAQQAKWREEDRSQAGTPGPSSVPGGI